MPVIVNPDRPTGGGIQRKRIRARTTGEGSSTDVGAAWTPQQVVVFWATAANALVGTYLLTCLPRVVRPRPTGRRARSPSVDDPYHRRRPSSSPPRLGRAQRLAPRATVSADKPDVNPLVVGLATAPGRRRCGATGQPTCPRYSVPDGVLTASTVDSWQGQTNRITIALRPLS